MLPGLSRPEPEDTLPRIVSGLSPAGVLVRKKPALEAHRGH
jgi:hypothetical protein